jgi:hypothetical protein
MECSTRNYKGHRCILHASISAPLCGPGSSPENVTHAIIRHGRTTSSRGHGPESQSFLASPSRNRRARCEGKAVVRGYSSALDVDLAGFCQSVSSSGSGGRSTKRHLGEGGQGFCPNTPSPPPLPGATLGQLSMQMSVHVTPCR